MERPCPSSHGRSRTDPSASPCSSLWAGQPSGCFIRDFFFFSLRQHHSLLHPNEESSNPAFRAQLAVSRERLFNILPP